MKHRPAFVVASLGMILAAGTISHAGHSLQTVPTGNKLSTVVHRPGPVKTHRSTIEMSAPCGRALRQGGNKLTTLELACTPRSIGRRT